MITITIAVIGWALFGYQRWLAWQASSPLFVMTARRSEYGLYGVIVSITVRNRAPSDLFVHAIEIVSEGTLYFQEWHYSAKVGPAKRIELERRIMAYAGGTFPSDEFEVWLGPGSEDRAVVCLRIYWSRRMDAMRSKSFKDCLIVQRQKTNSPS